MTTIRTYSELLSLSTFEERFKYLKIQGEVGNETFGFDRYLNQKFYKSGEWLEIRNKIITRDLGCDLAVSDMEIHGRILIHHMNPITKEDIIKRSDFLLNPEYLICTSENTHRAIHYSDSFLVVQAPVERRPYDTCPWKR